jgi:hypothetical protein
VTAVAITGLAVGFGLGILATHAAQNLKRRLRRKVNRVLRTKR